MSERCLFMFSVTLNEKFAHRANVYTHIDEKGVLAVVVGGSWGVHVLFVHVRVYIEYTINKYTIYIHICRES